MRLSRVVQAIPIATSPKRSKRSISNWCQSPRRQANSVLKWESFPLSIISKSIRKCLLSLSTLSILTTLKPRCFALAEVDKLVLIQRSLRSLFQLRWRSTRILLRKSRKLSFLLRHLRLQMQDMKRSCMLWSHISLRKTSPRQARKGWCNLFRSSLTKETSRTKDSRCSSNKSTNSLWSSRNLMAWVTPQWTTLHSRCTSSLHPLWVNSLWQKSSNW